MTKRCLVSLWLSLLPASAALLAAAGCGTPRPGRALAGPPVRDAYWDQPGRAAPSRPAAPALPPPPDVAARPASYEPPLTPAAGPPPASRADLYEPAQIVARVGDQPIMLGELLGQANQMLAPFIGKYPQDEIERQRTALIKQLLQMRINTKLMYLDFLRELPDKSRLPEIEENILKLFQEKQLPVLMEKAGVDTPGQYDAYLRRYGSSLEQTKKVFIEQVLASQSRNKNVDKDVEITHQEMLEQYRRNLKQYEIPAKVRWEQLMVRFDRFPDRRAAYAALAAMGNEVLRGASFAAVAQRSSQGVRARQGGYHDWTGKGSLVSEVLDRRLFELPPGKLSEILEDDDGFHILRVIERREARRVPFVEAQVEIKEQLRKQKIKQQQQAYLEKLRARTPIWTIFDPPSGPARSAARGDALGSPSDRRPF